MTPIRELIAEAIQKNSGGGRQLIFCRDDADAVLSALAAANLVIVPRGGTSAMYHGFRSVNCEHGTDGMAEFTYFRGDLGNWRACYDAMISAHLAQKDSGKESSS